MGKQVNLIFTASYKEAPRRAMANLRERFNAVCQSAEALGRFCFRGIEWTVGANPQNPQQDIYAVATASEVFLLENAVAAMNDLGLFKGLAEHPLPVIWGRSENPFVAIHIDALDMEKIGRLSARLPSVRASDAAKFSGARP